ncbi:MAG: hypothetical protein CW716_08695 [Candidatus Bathyarchaeum sp.]|nr:MAG: hypothetical protein CW716_08695 [Candidatus Bathyarchaeum sp.]
MAVFERFCEFRQESLHKGQCLFANLGSSEKVLKTSVNLGNWLVGRAGFEPATARYLWPRQARMKPTMGRPLQLLRPLDKPAGSRALPG